MSKRVGRPPRLILQVRQLLCQDWVAPRRVGEPLPGERELAAQYRVSRPTIRSALELLEAEKRVVRRPRAGYFVTEVASAGGRFVGKQIGLAFARGWNLFSGPTHLALLQGLYRELLSAGLSMVIPAADWQWVHKAKVGDFFRGEQVLGVFVIDRQETAILESLRSLHKPLVALDFDGTAEGLDSFCYANHAAGAALARRLQQWGHQRVAAVFESLDKPAAARDEAWTGRREGFLNEWAKTGLPAPTVVPLAERGNPREVLARVGELLERPPSQRPSALVLADGSPLDGLKELARQRRLKIPDALTVVGFGSLHDPLELTGYRFDGEQLGTQAAQLMLARVCWRQRPAPEPLLRLLKGRYVAGKTHATNRGPG